MVKHVRADATHPGELRLVHGVPLEGSERLFDLVLTVGARGNEVDRRVGEDVAVAVRGGGDRLAGGDLRRLHQAPPEGGGESDDPGRHIPIQTGEEKMLRVPESGAVLNLVEIEEAEGLELPDEGEVVSR